LISEKEKRRRNQIMDDLVVGGLEEILEEIFPG